MTMSTTFKRNVRKALAVAATLGVGVAGVQAFSIFSQQNSVGIQYSASSWGIELNGVAVDGSEATFDLDEFENMTPGDTTRSTATLTNTGSLPVATSLESLVGAGALAPHIDISAVGVVGDFAYGTSFAEAQSQATGSWGFPGDGPYVSLDQAAAVSNTSTVVIPAGDSYIVEFRSTLRAATTVEDAAGKTAAAVATFGFTQAPSAGDNQSGGEGA